MQIYFCLKKQKMQIILYFLPKAFNASFAKILIICDYFFDDLIFIFGRLFALLYMQPPVVGTHRRPSFAGMKHMPAKELTWALVFFSLPSTNNTVSEI